MTIRVKLHSHGTQRHQCQWQYRLLGWDCLSGRPRLQPCPRMTRIRMVRLWSQPRPGIIGIAGTPPGRRQLPSAGAATPPDTSLPRPSFPPPNQQHKDARAAREARSSRPRPGAVPDATSPRRRLWRQQSLSLPSLDAGARPNS